MGDFLFPDVGEGIHEGKIVSIKVHEGDTVKDDQVLVEVETDKAIVEIPSPQAGVIAKIHFGEGDVVKVGQPLITFGDGSAAAPVSTPAPAAPESKTQTPKRDVESGTKKVESNLTPVPPAPEEHVPKVEQAPKTVEARQGPITAHPTHILATPSTRRYAREKQLDINSLKGSGPHGRITRQDIDAATGATPPTPTAPQVPASSQPAPQPAVAQIPVPQLSAPVQTPPPLPAPSVTAGTTIPYDGMRKAIGDHMKISHEYPWVTLTAQADVSEMMEMRSHYKEKAASAGVKLTPLAFFAKAVCAAIHKHPIVNSSLVEQGIQVFNDIHFGIAVDTQRGLVVPVVTQADRKSVLDIARDIQTLADLARQGKLTNEQMHGGTFSISSIGPLRVEGFTPKINPPQSTILGIGGIHDRPWIVDGKIQVRKVVSLSVTFDHRVYDGAQGARFLTDLITFLEDPGMLILEGM